MRALHGAEEAGSVRFWDSLGGERVWERDDAHASGLGK